MSIPSAAPLPPLRLNLGCGRNAMPGWVNVDWKALPGRFWKLAWTKG